MAALTAGCRQFPRIKEVRAYVVEGKEGDQGADCHDVADEHWINGNDPSTGRTPIANPMSGYAQYAGARKSWGINAMGGLVVEVEADDGTTGCGVTIGGEAGCIIVEKHLSRRRGRDPRRRVHVGHDVARDDQLRPQGPAHPVHLRRRPRALGPAGEAAGEPVTRSSAARRSAAAVYCTTARPDVAKDLGFVGAKIPPTARRPATRASEERRVLREMAAAVGPDFLLSLDCYMALTVPYAIKLGNALKDHGIKWMEEFLPPDDYEGYKEVKRSRAPACSEHRGARVHALRLPQAHEDRSVDILQPDITWLGGLTEARRQRSR
ncbi:mandelate racemase/muconate lactonizing enzyme [Aureococcus anophagefferens]|nr:mandelate racemase/muconate lactonizing enzyme [Aureococcus anophagefferens]